MDHRKETLKSKVNMIGSVLTTMYQMADLYHSHPDFDQRMKDDPCTETMWRMYCKEIMDFLREAPLVHSATVVNLLSRDAKISFTKILPYVGDEYQNTVNLVREYVRRMIVVEGQVHDKVAKDAEYRKDAGDLKAANEDKEVTDA